MPAGAGMANFGDPKPVPNPHPGNTTPALPRGVYVQPYIQSGPHPMSMSVSIWMSDHTNMYAGATVAISPISPFMPNPPYTPPQPEVPQGWQCPLCDEVHSPSVETCPCSKRNDQWEDIRVTLD